MKPASTKKMIRNLFWILGFLIFLLGIGHLYYHLTGDFRIAHVMSKTFYPLQVELPKLTAKERRQVGKILDQHFYFLGHGHQSFVFASDDGNYVLKLFRKDFIKRTWLKNVIPPITPFRSLFLHQGKGEEYRIRRVINGHAIAYALDRDNCGMIYFHFNQENRFGKAVTLVDKLGIKRTIIPESYVFAIQKRAVTTRQELTRLMAEGNVEETKRRIQQLFDFYLSAYRRGILDNDHKLIDNTGFVGDRVIRQDVGRLVLDPETQNLENIKTDLRKIVRKRLQPWFKSYYPQYYSEISEEMEQFLSEL